MMFAKNPKTTTPRPTFSVPSIRDDETYAAELEKLNALKHRLAETEGQFYDAQDKQSSRRAPTGNDDAVSGLLADPHSQIATVAPTAANLGDLHRETVLLRKAIERQERVVSAAACEAATRIYEASGVREQYETMLQQTLPILEALAEQEQKLVAFSEDVCAAGLSLRHGANPLNMNMADRMEVWVRQCQNDGYKVK